MADSPWKPVVWQEEFAHDHRWYTVRAEMDRDDWVIWLLDLQWLDGISVNEAIRRINQRMLMRMREAAGIPRNSRTRAEWKDWAWERRTAGGRLPDRLEHTLSVRVPASNDSTKET